MNTEDAKFSINENSQLDISNLKKTKCNFLIRNREFAIFSKINSFFKIEPSLVPYTYKYSNTLMLQKEKKSSSGDNPDEIGKGVSGGPIFNKNNLVVGVYLGCKQQFEIHYILCSKYITKYIRYRSNYEYDTYCDLPLRLKFLRE
jgi:hypothetical protein